MVWMAAENVVDALGISDSESITAISRAFSFLGITTSCNEPGADRKSNHRLSIPLDGTTDENASHAEFNFTSKRWALKGSNTKPSLSKRPRLNFASIDERIAREEEDWTSQLPQTDHSTLEILFRFLNRN